MPEVLTICFINDLHSFDTIFEATNEPIYSVVNIKFKKNIRIYNLKFKPSFFAFLHTHDRHINFNHHIHVIFSENLLFKNSFKLCTYLDYDALYKRFIFILLNKIEKYFDKEYAMDFIKKLVKHILPHNFKSIRSYRYYNKPSKFDKNTNMIISKEKFLLGNHYLNCITLWISYY